MKFKIGQHVTWCGNDMVVTAVNRVPPGAVRIIDADVITEALVAAYKVADKATEFVFVPGITVSVKTLTAAQA